MEQHLSHSALVRVFSGKATGPEVDAAIPHLPRCPRCWSLAATVIAELRKADRLVHPPDARSAVLTLLAEEEREALSRLRARAAWAELKRLSPEQQRERIKIAASLQSQELFDTVLAAAFGLAPNDPYLGEETALLAHALAGSLPQSRYPTALRNDLQSQAMIAVANCRRLAADWRGSAAALSAARRHLERGTGEPKREARFLSIQASLAADTGHLEQAEACLARASSIYRSAGDPAALASVAVQHAGTLLAACRHDEAVSRAEEALALLLARDARLEVLARNIITASLVFLDRPASALMNYLATRPLFEQLGERRFELQSGYLEALLLDSFGHVREAEKAFRRNIESRLEAELYKDAFLTMLTRVELLFRRGALDKAAKTCEEALETLQETGVAPHGQMEELWRSLLALANARRLTEHQMLAARHYLVRHWSAPARHSPLERAGGSSDATVLARQASAGSVTFLSAIENKAGLPSPIHAPAPPARLLGVDYETALERYDSALIAVGLAQTGGRVAATSRLLGISRNTLREKIKRYDFRMGIAQSTSEPEGAGHDRLSAVDRAALSRLRARAWWAELKALPTAKQLARLGIVLALQTRELFDTILEEACASALSDPRRGEATASVAFALAGLLPKSHYSEPVRNDLQGAALMVVANCGRLAGDWPGSAAALKASRSHLDRGTGDPAREARLLSIQASLATDMGHYQEALVLLARASAIYRRTQDAAGAAFTKVQEAGTLLAASRHAEALARSEEVLLLLTPKQARLELLARNIVTASLVFLARPTDALRSLHAARPLYEQFSGPPAQFQLTYLEALVLDSMGHELEAETVFRANIAGRMEAGHYKDAFLTMLTRVELLFRRGELAKAARACEEAIEVMKDAGKDRHAQTIDLFRDLLTLVNARRLSEPRLLEARQALVRHSALDPVEAVPLAMAAAARQVEPSGPASEGSQPLRGSVPEPEPLPTRLGPGDYEAALQRYEREVIAAALTHCRGRIADTCRLLGISRNTLRARMSRYGLKP